MISGESIYVFVKLHPIIKPKINILLLFKPARTDVAVKPRSHTLCESRLAQKNLGSAGDKLVWIKSNSACESGPKLDVRLPSNIVDCLLERDIWELFASYRPQSHTHKAQESCSRPYI